MQVDDTTWQVFFPDSVEDPGFVVKIFDDTDTSNSYAVTLYLRAGSAPAPPAFADVPGTDTVVAGTDYSRWLEVTDMDTPAGQLSFTVLQGPDGMAMGNDTVVYSPTEEDTGTYDVSVEVSDGQSQDTLDYALVVIPDSSSATVPGAKGALPSALSLSVGRSGHNGLSPDVTVAVPSPSPAIKLDICSPSGRQVRTLHHGPLAPGWHTFGIGVAPASGLVLVRMLAGKNSLIQRCVLVR